MNVLLLMRHTLHYWPPVILLAVIFLNTFVIHIYVFVDIFVMLVT